MATKKLLPHLRKLYQTPFYQCWSNMKRRCDDPTNVAYNRYGGRGIAYDPRWTQFEAFYEDMYPTFRQGLTLDRTNNNENYSMRNCRWATIKEQCNNRRTSRYFTIDGVTQTLAQWIDTTAIKPSTIRQRLYGYHWTLERALNTPVRKRG